MITGRIKTSIHVGGRQIISEVERSSDRGFAHDVELPAAKAGTLTERTSDSVGDLTMSPGHGFIGSDTIDLYWETGNRYGITVESVDGNTVSISGGNGSNLPADESPITASLRTQIAIDFDGDNLSLFATALISDDRAAVGHIEFTSDSGVSMDVAEAGATVLDLGGWDIASVFAGETVTTAAASNGSSTHAATLRLLAIEDVTPDDVDIDLYHLIGEDLAVLTDENDNALRSLQ